MLSFDDYKKRYETVGTIGQQLKVMSDEVVQETFDNDIGTRQCYIYDYYHDDQSDMEYGYNPLVSKTKIPVKLKFIVKTYKSLAKDDPEYHIMFEPDVWNSMSCKPNWFVKNYQKFGIQFPIGLYCDIPDDRGVYHRWIIMYHEVANQFPKFGVLKCNYRFKWIENDGLHRHKRKMWGIDRTQLSYTSGVWRGDKMQVLDETNKFILPWNPISAELKHDIRLFISMLQKNPNVYIISKIDNTSPKGVITFTAKQDRFEPDHDYVCLDPNNSDYGDMYADYYSSDVVTHEDAMEYAEKMNAKGYVMKIEAPNYNVKIGTSKVLYAKIYDAEDNDITELFIDSECDWNVDIVDVKTLKDSLITNFDSYLDVYKDVYGNKKYRFKCKFKFDGDEQYINNNIIVTCKIEELSSEVSLDIIAL